MTRPFHTTTSTRRRKMVIAGIVILMAGLTIALATPLLLRTLGRFLVVTEDLQRADAAVVLNTGVEYVPRLLEACRLFREQKVRMIVINGNRKTEAIRKLDAAGFRPACIWYADFLRIVKLQGVPRERVLLIGLEDAYDTVSEARGVGPVLIRSGMRRVIVTTSKYHTRRARHIWRSLFAQSLDIQCAAASQDPYDPVSWWRDGRQVRWVLAEYGAWLYYGWKKLRKADHEQYTEDRDGGGRPVT